MKKTRSIAVKSRPSRQRTKRGKCLHWTEESMPAAQCRRRSAADRVGTYCQQQWSTDGDRDTCTLHNVTESVYIVRDLPYSILSHCW